MPSLNLYPYNYYVLYAALVLLLLFLILTAVKLLSTVKSLNEMKPGIEHLQKNLQMMQIKTDVIKEKQAADAKRNALILKALPILLAVQAVYKSSDSYSGLKGYVNAAQKVFNDRNAEQKLITKIKKAL